ncbi:HD domain-containing protein [Pseudothermotoga sp.]|uniref:3'-5' exoribonuclease YhaM family protein n=1 Tax=Pseudothermotoga sp. TaxID=2033661 RepID=UPI00258C346A|nr:HD domain-containing protein [Pseudothermotoga sp.]MDK2885224.1 3-5 exoribonuclease [Pseudothermotoga sp.]
MKLGDRIPKEIFNELKPSKEPDFPYLEDLGSKVNENVQVIAKVTSRKLQEARDQKKFLLMTLSDKTGSIRAIDWYNADENFLKINDGDVVVARGRIVYFEDHIQLNLEKSADSIKNLNDSEYDFRRFLEVTSRDIDKMYEKLIVFVKEISDSDLKKLLEKIFIEDTEFVKLFVQCPAGVSVHHAYIGGLLEHTVDVVSSCKKIWQVYDSMLNKDLLLAGAMIHDIGKVREYRVTQKGFEVTTEGELKGHIVLGVEAIREVAYKIGLTGSKLLHLEHIILSHHGEIEWGSPVVPKTAEAFVIHSLENMDAKLARFRYLQEKGKKNGNEKIWTDYDRHLQRRLWLGGQENEN